jgi:hypothetical protein
VLDLELLQPPGIGDGKEMPSEPQLVDVHKIQLDLSNYRIGKQQSPEDCLRAMIDEQGPKLVRLAQHILDHGVNPLESLAVVPADRGEFISVEGNRRVTVLKLLHQPQLAKGTSVETQFARLSKRKESLPKQIRCVVFGSKEEAYVWIRLKHDVGWAGEATESWKRIARLRAIADQGENRPAHDLLEFVMGHGSLDDDLTERLAGHDFPVSTLERLLGSESVRAELGLSVGVGHLQGKYDKNWTLSILSEIVRIIGNAEFQGGPFSVKTVYTVTEQKAFIEKLLKQIPRPTAVYAEWPLFADTDMTQQQPAQPTTSTGRETAKTTVKKSAPKSNPRSVDRTHLVDARTPVKPPVGRANDILWELKKLDIDKFTNAVSILLRVFLEMSIDQYISKHSTTIPQDAKLAARAQAVVNDMRKKKLMSDFKAISVAIGTRDSIVSIGTLHAYVHHPTFHPSPKELKVAWDRLEPFIATLWQ